MLPPIGGGQPDGAHWSVQLAKLTAYKGRHGDCNVPRGWVEDPPLGSWVDRQRQLKRKLDRGEACKGMTAAGAVELEALGLEWEVSAAVRSKHTSNAKRDDAGWERWLVKLKAYKHMHGGCNVPRSWSKDPMLARWVAKQRGLKRALDRGEACKEGQLLSYKLRTRAKSRFFFKLPVRTTAHGAPIRYSTCKLL